ncbi:MAG: metallophosphoesterase [Sphingobacteriales bacterium]|nr:metallophosphoesterase [Sphingobacteriales bacterium]
MSMTFMLINNAFSQAASRKIILISTNDPHGRLDNFPKMAAYVQFLKRTNPEVFVLNAGDLVDGNPIIDQIKDKGAPIIDIMNSVPYDVSCLGNHELCSSI